MNSHIIRSHADFVAARCIDGYAVAKDMHLAADELDRLQAIVDQYPKTKDGVSIVPEMRLWFVNARHEVAEVGPMKMADSEGWLSDFEVDVYSTAEAAEAAKDNQPKGTN